ncbi:MAG TPA: Gfo/Idh/MocA family oxidoreductase [Tepidisphaeraceae bacterium]|jgi:predicted dehydrogenase|nr:Gfo/Idh/MocA family oxidoreductase [Tepidisphaeraceae bacterium]
MAAKSLNVCMIGYKFMGRAHSNAYMKVGKFFDVPVQPVMHTVVGRNRADLEAFKDRWGWQTASIDWRTAVTNPDVQLVDIGTPNNQHKDMTLAALEAGKHVFCEKPLAATLADAREMRDAARKVKRKAKTFVSYSYRRVPALALAHQLAKEGRLGRIYHVRAFYLQGWASSPDIPLVWRFDKEAAGSGSHGDLGAHIIDMARFVTGDEIVEVSGAISETFIKERVIPTGVAGAGIASGAKGGSGKKGKVTVDDTVLFLARFKGGAVASFESTRFATGRENKNGLEVNGENGSIYFDFEDLNNLMYFDATQPRKVQGWTKIQASVPGEHPYAFAYWPTAHPGGYEHAFVNQTYDMMQILGGKEPVVPLPDFEDAYKTQQVLEAAAISAKERMPIKVSQVG